MIKDFDSLFIKWYQRHFQKQSMFSNLSEGGWSYQKNKEKKFTMFEVVSQTEQAPHPDNRVMLSRKLDQLGCAKAQPPPINTLEGCGYTYKVRLHGLKANLWKPTQVGFVRIASPF